MKRLLRVLVVISALLAAAFGSVGPAAGHCVQTPVGWADLAPGHFAAAGGHIMAIEHSGGAVGAPCSGTELNASAPDNNPG